jgi:hypothetical protein
MYNYFDKFKVNYTIFYDLTLFFHVVKLKRMKVKLKESFNLLLMKIYPDFSEITNIKMCLSSKENNSPHACCQVVFSILKSKIKRIILIFFCQMLHVTCWYVNNALYCIGKVNVRIIDSVISHAKKELTTISFVASVCI